MTTLVPGGLISHLSSPVCTRGFASKLLCRARKNIAVQKNIFLGTDVVCLNSSSNQSRETGKVKP